jgi:hypothetical protein
MFRKRKIDQIQTLAEQIAEEENKKRALLDKKKPLQVSFFPILLKIHIFVENRQIGQFRHLFRITLLFWKNVVKVAHFVPVGYLGEKNCLNGGKIFFGLCHHLTF